MNKKVLLVTVFVMAFLIGGLYIYEHISLSKYQKGLFNSQKSPIDISKNKDVQGIRVSNEINDLEKE